MRPLTFLILLFGALGCSRPEPDATQIGSATARLKPVGVPLPEPTVQRTVYVPIYSSIYTGLDINRSMMDLAATVSVRNVSTRQRIVLDQVRYYDSAGKLVRKYLDTPSELGPLASVEFVVQQFDKAGGPGANFLVRWTGPADVDEPIIEAVMIGNGGNLGYSFVSVGRTIKNEPLP